ncbi:alpha/beta hydrolase [Kolteria novifilia]|uniref:alpha/beta hydrolase n=1 Tax=Kolteria novifilia TaxID=2527975 RepID=UPI003AF3357D
MCTKCPAGDPALAKLNAELAGRLVDYTKNHGADRRIWSESLGCRRDLYVYLPPNYDPNMAYSVMIWLHGAFGDERFFLDRKTILALDGAITNGTLPPMIVAAPDGIVQGNRRWSSTHSFYVNGSSGRFGDYIIQDVVPFVSSQYAILPERRAHTILGISAGGYGALSLGLRNRDYFGNIVALAAPANFRYSARSGRYFTNFNPSNYRWRELYRPAQVVGKYFAIIRLRAGRFLNPVFGPREQVLDKVRQTNPADLIRQLPIQPGEVDILLHYPGLDNFNFDAQNESFQWIAASEGIEVDAIRKPLAMHWSPYFRKALWDVYAWLRCRVPGPRPIGELTTLGASPAAATVK